MLQNLYLINLLNNLKIDKKKYLTNLEVFVKKNEIDIIIPVSEPELRFYTKNKKIIETLKPVRVLLANEFSREVGFNKGKTRQGF